MKYYKQLNESGDIVYLLTYDREPNITNELTVGITETEYNETLAEMREKARLVDQLYYGEITIGDIPEEWQTEIQRKVDERIAEIGTAEEQEISDSEALNIILGGETE